MAARTIKRRSAPADAYDDRPRFSDSEGMNEDVISEADTEGREGADESRDASETELAFS